MPDAFNDQGTVVEDVDEHADAWLPAGLFEKRGGQLQRSILVESMDCCRHEIGVPLHGKSNTSIRRCQI